MSERMVAMLRGVNVGGRNPLAMASLRERLAEAGFTDVATYLQSGNVVLATALDADAVAARVREIVSVPVAVRTAAEMRAVVDRDPLPGAAGDPKRYVVTFLADAPGPDALERLRGLAVDDERLHAEGRELYTHHPDGQARSKLAAALTGRALGPSATARNWSTVTRLAEMSAG